MAQCSATTRESNAGGTFQHFTVAHQLPVCPLPDGISYEAAAALPLAMSTAAAGMYPASHLALELPSLNPKQSGKTLLIWGGSSSVGCCAIQLAVASGLSVVTTCSPRNFELCKKLGATEVFDHNSETVVDDLTSALGKGPCVGVYNGEFCLHSISSLHFWHRCLRLCSHHRSYASAPLKLFLLHGPLTALTSRSDLESRYHAEDSSNPQNSRRRLHRVSPASR